MDAKLNVIKAWDKLEGDKHYSPKEIEKWLIKDLGPAIKELRTYASHMPSVEILVEFAMGISSKGQRVFNEDGAVKIVSQFLETKSLTKD